MGPWYVCLIPSPSLILTASGKYEGGDTGKDDGKWAPGKSLQSLQQLAILNITRQV